MKSCHFFIFSVLLLSGCASQHPVATPVPGSVMYQQQNQIDNLKKGGVQVIQLGDELRLVLPTKRFFGKNTYTLQATSLLSLDQIVALLNQRKNFGISVLAYTPSLEVADDFKANTSLEQQQAQAIVDYLLQHGLNTRLITASAWTGVSDKQKQGTGCFSDDAPGVFSVEIRARLLQPEQSQ
ncbi:OmpA family protein [Rickettsiella endosymbiont of Dermanyssus gallinae]|uniref:OmpA family protein n=1 Tax=Rickettsiella endosymbiont of Dermanyssus gallinae TaxID=2856608 RepID=UPI001C52FC96|nr:OmpA family protein [Rickettsiella endosymbiont of Dermanyssus gallinae]